MTNSLSGNYRVFKGHGSGRESSVMYHLRHDIGLSINHIAEIMGRSTSTVHYWVSGLSRDNRRLPPLVRSKGKWSFMEIRGSLKIRIKGFIKGI